jgi:hypothetical protein
VKRERNALQQEHYADPTEEQYTSEHLHSEHYTPDYLPRALRFWPSDFLATPRELFAHSASDLDPYYSSRPGRPARMIRYDAPSDEILL